MFTDQERNAYHAITAPDELFQKITAKPKKQNSVWYMIAGMAACFVLILSGVLMNSRSTHIMINGQRLEERVEFYVATASLGRTVSSAISVPVEIEASGQTTVCVEQGFLSVDGQAPSKEMVITSDTVLWWEIEPDRTVGEFEMRITNKKGVQRVSLKYENGKITATKENEK